jgi:folate-binding protein YgfZ
VQVQDLRSERLVLALLGAGVDDALAEAGLEPPAAANGAHAGAEIAGTPVWLARTPDLGAPGVEVHVPAAAATAVWDALEALTGEPPACAGWHACEALRIEAGVPRMGHEITAAEFPQELRLNDAVDYQKGCYLGQETVARIHYRGRVNRLLCGLRGDGPLPAGAELILSDKQVGRITSTAPSPHGAVALALIRREDAESNATVQVRDGGETVAEARVMTPPFGG